MTRFALTIEYDGQPFMGWQRQPHGPTVQATIETAASIFARAPVAVHAAGRTDAGVHARAMVAHLDIERPTTPYRLIEAINALVRPAPISVLDCRIVAPDFHARYSCTGRRYSYRIVNRRAPLALDTGKAWRLPMALDSDAMHAAAQLLVGRHDFTTFRSAHCQADSPTRTLDRLNVIRDGERITIEAAARSFLHHQVRSMVGCLSLVGRGRWTSTHLQLALGARDRTALGLNAPPDGLYFMGADY